MGLLQDIESLKYRFVLDLIKSEETYDKNKKVITGKDAFKICLDRYNLMQRVLLPLRKKLGDKVVVKDITFVTANDDEKGIMVKYVKDNQSYFLSISNVIDEDICVVASDIRVQSDEFIENNRNILLQTFKDIGDNSLDEDIIIKSTTGKYIIKDNCDSFNIKDNESKIFSIDGKYSSYKSDGILSNPDKLTCDFPKLKELLLNDSNIFLIYDHLHIYEDELPKKLTKKLTNR